MKIENTLNQRIDRAIEVYKNAVASYTDAKALLSNYNSESDTAAFIKCKDVYGNLYGACDPLLRVLAITHHVKCPFSAKDPNDPKKEIITWRLITEENDSEALYTKEFCCAIANYNKEAKCRNKELLLPDLDLQCLISEKKERNEKEHLAVLSQAFELYRMFYNLYKIIRLLKPDADIGLPSVPVNLFDWDVFDERMNCFDATQHRFILIAVSSFHNMSSEQLGYLLQINWSAIIDFDGTSDMGGLKTAIEKNGISVETKALVDFNGVNTNYMLTNKPFYINLFTSADFGKNFNASPRNLASDNRPLDKLMKDVLYSANYEEATIVILGEPNARINDICIKVRNSFDKTNIICISEQVKFATAMISADDPNDYEDDDISTQPHINTDSHQICCDLFNFLKSLEEHEQLLPNKNNQITLGDGYRMPVTGENNTQVITDMNLISILETTFEFLHTNLCEGSQAVYNIEEKEQFLRGGVVSWSNILNNDAVLLIEPEKLKQFEGNIVKAVEKRATNSHRFYLEHNPGYGGTTLGRVISWDLHKTIPVVLLKHYHDINDLTEKLRYLYSNLLNNSAYLVLIDEDIFSGTMMYETEKLFERIDIPVFGLFVRRKTTNSSLRALPGTTLPLCSFNKNIKSLLRMKCQELLNNNSIIEKRWNRMNDELDERQICPLLVNLHLLVDNFTLQNYVKRFLDKIPKDDIEGGNKRTALAYLAVCHYYGNLPFSSSMINDIIGSVRKGDDITKQNLAPVMDLLLIVKLSDNSMGFRTRHYQIAEEMLHQLIGNDNPMLPLPLGDCSNNLIDFMCRKCHNNHIDPIIQEMITNLFTDKTAGRYIENSQTNCTLLLSSMSPKERLSTIYYLAKIFGDYIEGSIDRTIENKNEYRLLAHIYAQCANVGSDEGEVYDAILNYCSKAEDIISAFQLQDYDLAHIIGMCHLTHAENLIVKDNFESIYIELKKAVSCFEDSIIYGSPSYGIPMKFRAVTTFLKRFIERDNIRDNNYDKLVQDPKAVEFLTFGYSTIQEMDDYELTVKGESLAIQYRDEFFGCCFPDNPSRAVEQLDELLNRIDKGDLGGRLAVTSGIIHNYQRKYYNKDTQRNELLIRAYSGKDKDKEAKKDAKKVFERLNSLVQEGYHISNALYKMWFNYAKFSEVSLRTSMDVAMRWKNSINEYGVPDETGLLWASYYLYVITMLLYVNEGIGTADGIENRRLELKKCLQYNRQSSTVRDWLSNGNGMGALVSNTVIDIADVVKSARIRIVEGTANITGDREGYLMVESLPRLSQIGRPSIGSSINKNMCVFFSPGACGILKEQADGSQKWKFKFGFSFERMLVSQNSLVDLNSRKADIELCNEKSSLVSSPTKLTSVVETIPLASPDFIPTDEVFFVPKYVYTDRYDTAKVFLIGNAGEKEARISVTDIQKYSLELSNIDITAIDALYRLAALPEIRVKVIGSNGRGQYILSLHATNQSLASILVNPATDEHSPLLATLNKSEIPDLQPEPICVLPDIVELVEFTAKVITTRGLSGTLKYNNTLYDGTITAGLSQKLKKFLLNSTFKARVIAKSKDKYILKKC